MTSTRLVVLLTGTPLSLADARARLSRLVARVSGQHERIYVTVHGSRLPCSWPRRPRVPGWDQRSAVTGAGSMSSKDWFSPAMAHTNE
jgi:hypothetical protein